MRHILFAVAMAMVFWGCFKRDTQFDLIPEEDSLNPNTFIIDPSRVLSSDDSSLVITLTTVDSLSVGAVIISAPSTNAPMGFLRRITGIENVGGSYRVTTELAGLMDAFASLHIDTTFDDDLTRRDSIAGGYGVQKWTNWQVGGGMSLNITWNMYYPGHKFAIDKRKGEFTPRYLYYSYPFNNDGSSIELSITSSFTSPEARFGRIRLPTFRIIAMGIPVILVHDLEMLAGPVQVDLVKGKLEVVPSLNGAIGFKYENGELTGIHDFDFNITSPPLKEQSFDKSKEAGFTLTLPNIRYNLRPYGQQALKFSGEVPGRVSGTFKKSSPNYKIQMSLDVSVAASLSFFTIGGELRYTRNLVKPVTILEGDWKKDSAEWYAKNFVPGSWVYSVPSFTGQRDNSLDLIFNNDAKYNEEHDAWFGTGVGKCEHRTWYLINSQTGEFVRYQETDGCDGQVIKVDDVGNTHKHGGREIVWRVKQNTETERVFDYVEANSLTPDAVASLESGYHFSLTKSQKVFSVSPINGKLEKK